MAETRTILFLGASYAGLGATHYFLKHVYPHLPTSNGITYRAVLVDPSSKWFVRHASPRGSIREELIPSDQMFLDIEPGFKQYGDKFHFIQGKAVAWDETKRTVKIETTNGTVQDISYWALILGTGSKTYSPLFSQQGATWADVQAAHTSIRQKLPTAKSIIVAGGGAVGVEFAGEVGETLNGAAGWFKSRPSHPKAQITLITSSAKLLPQLRQAISDQAETLLHRVGVDVKYKTKITSTKVLPDGKTLVLLADGTEMEADVYIPAMGVKPLSEYVPDHLKDGKGYVVQNNETLRVDAAGPRVYALGDIGTYSGDGIFDIINGLPVLETNLKRDLMAAHSNPDAKPSGKDRLFVKNEKETQLVPVGRSKGVGAVFGWRVPSVFVWMIKGRDFMISGGPKRVDGRDFEKESMWKEEALNR